MKDIYHYIGGDLSTSPTGDLRPVENTERGKQRVLRRLITNPGDYIYHPTYGAGLGQKVGEVGQHQRMDGANSWANVA